MSTSNTEEIRQMLDLEHLQYNLIEEGFQLDLLGAEQGFTQPFIALKFASQTFNQVCQMQLVYLPSAHFLNEMNLLQCYFTFPIKITNSDKINTLLTKLNLMMPLGSFFFNEFGEMAFRYVYTLPRFQVPEKIHFMEILKTVLGTIEDYSKLIVQINSGEISLNDLFK